MTKNAHRSTVSRFRAPSPRKRLEEYVVETLDALLAKHGFLIIVDGRDGLPTTLLVPRTATEGYVGELALAAEERARTVVAHGDGDTRDGRNARAAANLFLGELWRMMPSGRPTGAALPYPELHGYCPRCRRTLRRAYMADDLCRRCTRRTAA